MIIYDLIVIGGGHAGIEACNMASRQGVRVALITKKGVSIGSAPCNPSIGGLGKGQVVKEIDSLGGLMGLIADKSGIQYRTLNESKGYAVQSTRVQIDKDLYSKEASRALDDLKNLNIFYCSLEGVRINNDETFFLETSDGDFVCKKLVLTVGTFLNGKIHRGNSSYSGGRDGSGESKSINSIFNKVSVNPKRFKTGTPPRILRSSIDFSEMSEQPSDNEVLNLSIYNAGSQRASEQVSCYLTYTCEETMSIIRDNKEKSPMFNGQISGVGARYCPSIEDKAYRYLDKNIHHVFVEPEGLNLDTFYPSGISSSLPEEIQQDFLRTIQGLSKAEVEVYGYAVEYDVVDTTMLTNCLEYKDVKGLYFAGQVNGTSGYEEAAAQGLVAGLNAALSIKKANTVNFKREDSYIGVIIEDLIGNTRDEPYRLFTARSENRLELREDNAFIRMHDYLLEFNDKDVHFERVNDLITEYHELMGIVNSTFVKSTDFEDTRLEIFISKLDKKISLKDILKISFVDPIKVLKDYLSNCSWSFSPIVLRSAAIEMKYCDYIEKNKVNNSKISKIDSRSLNLNRILDSENISFECKERIKKISPSDFGQLRRINGIRQATIAVISSGNY